MKVDLMNLLVVDLEVFATSEHGDVDVVFKIGSETSWEDFLECAVA
jgi:hypothetical protein